MTLHQAHNGRSAGGATIPHEETPHAYGFPLVDEHPLLRSLVHNAPDIVAVLEADGTVRYINPAVHRVLGHRPEELVGTSVLDLIHPDDLEQAQQNLAENLANPGLRPPYESRLPHRDGSWRHFEHVVNNLIDDPDVGGLVVNSRDITDRVVAERALRESVGTVHGILSNFPNGSVSIFDRDLRYVLAEGRGLAEVGLSSEMLVGKTLHEVFGEEGARQVEGHYRRAFSGETVRFELVVGGLTYAISATPLSRDGDGEGQTIIAVAQNVTEQKEAERRLAARVRQQAAVANLGRRALEGVDMGSFMEDVAGKLAATLGVEYTTVLELCPDGETLILRAGVGWREGLVGYATERAGRSSQSGYTLLADEPVILEELASETRFEASPFLREHSVRSGVTVLIRGKRELFGVLGIHTRQQRTFTTDDVDFLQTVANVVASAIETVRSEERLQHQALHDTLTDLPNRTLFRDRMEHALQRIGRREGTMVAVLFVDLDRFKAVNDSMGHEAGDMLLVAVAERLREFVRPEDTLARFGGDEFVVLLEEIDGPDEAVATAERIIEGLRDPFVLEGTEHFVSAAVGVAVGTTSTTSSENLLQEADAAMYEAKRESVDHRVFTPQMHERATGRLILEDDLRRAIDANEFILHHQPIVRLDGGAPLWMEALVRWRHPQRGLVPPMEFIPLAEETGLIAPIGRWVLREACRQAVQWNQARPSLAPLWVSVNVSAKQLRRQAFVVEVESVLQECELEAGLLVLEVTESALLEAGTKDRGILDRLRALGLRIAIDDFGTGYSSLSYLKRLPVDVLKMDGSFVKNMGEEAEDTVIVSMVVDLAHNLGMRIVAEGVETTEQAALLREMGCDYAQGFCFSKPLPPEEV